MKDAINKFLQTLNRMSENSENVKPLNHQGSESKISKEFIEFTDKNCKPLDLESSQTNGNDYCKYFHIKFTLNNLFRL